MIGKWFVVIVSPVVWLGILNRFSMVVNVTTKYKKLVA